MSNSGICSRRLNHKSLRLEMKSQESKLKIFIKNRDSHAAGLFKRLYTSDFRHFWISFQDKELEELLLADPNSGVYFPVSCQEYADNGASQNGSYRVQPDANLTRKYIWIFNSSITFESIIGVGSFESVQYEVKSFPIDCEFHAGVGYSVFYPSFSQSTQLTATPHQNDGCEEPGCYEDHVTYRRSLQIMIFSRMILMTTFCRWLFDGDVSRYWWLHHYIIYIRDFINFTNWSPISRTHHNTKSV